MEAIVQHLYPYLNFNIWEIIALSLLFITFIIQLLYYILYYKEPLKYVQDEDVYDDSLTIGKPMVSIIVVSENESQNLAQNLPFVLNQDYPNFEVIVVNNGSTDESYELLQSLKLEYPNLYHTYVPLSNDKAFGRKKLAFTIGVKAAKGDILLFTEPYSKPISNRWIWEMTRNMVDNKEIVLGYSYYTENTSFYNRVARFDNLLFSIKYILRAIQNKPFTGVYRNLAFKKNLFFDNKGFSSCLNIENGEEVFINHIINTENTAVALSPNSFVETTLSRYSLWRKIKKTYSIAQSHFKNKSKSFFSLETVSRYLFYILTIGLIIEASIFRQWGVLFIVLLLFLIRFIVQFNIINKLSSYLKSGSFGLSLIIMDIAQPLYNMSFRTREPKLNGRKGRA